MFPQISYDSGIAPNISMDSSIASRVKPVTREDSIKNVFFFIHRQFTRRLRNIRTKEKSVAEFVCEYSSGGVSAQWFHQQSPVEEGTGKYEVTNSHRVSRLEIKDLCLGDSGEVECIINGRSTSARLTVESCPRINLPELVDIFRTKLKSQNVREGAPAHFWVELDVDGVEVEWRADDQVIELTSQGVVLATERYHRTVLYDVESLHKIEPIGKHSGATFSGISPDFRVIIKFIRKQCANYMYKYDSEMGVETLAQGVSHIMQEYTQSGSLCAHARGVRPFGMSLLVAGWSEGKGHLYQCDPSGIHFPWKACAIGKNHLSNRLFLEKRYDSTMMLDDAVHTAILTLQDNFDGAMTEHDIDIALATPSGFRQLSAAEVKDYLSILK
ncbi:LOW QUALITY PROTEIN: proteasome subunit alpha type-2-like [Octopus sinensis]|uniref:LOW QUALITY PROTEIN: proteasome subunit alpha type-2-like n=1 Tax=Octopus sinensis TaxID=2607531 RepID=A0A7E6EH63_9MOLL|nr:LOW QUALITY PROTEIN: proteasome subunit alpha type-2-like [Octopus sinensis]